MITTSSHLVSDIYQPFVLLINDVDLYGQFFLLPDSRELKSRSSLLTNSITSNQLSAFPKKVIWIGMVCGEGLMAAELIDLRDKTAAIIKPRESTRI